MPPPSKKTLRPSHSWFIPIKTKDFKEGWIYDMDSTDWSLLLSNLLTIALALIQGWDLGVLMLVYWIQSVIIGVFHFLRLFIAKPPFAPGEKSSFVSHIANKGMAMFFLIHYGIFHLVYLVFISVFFAMGQFSSGLFAAIGSVFIASVVFFINHFYSFCQDLKDKARLSRVSFFSPYARILPMHLTLIFGAFFFKSSWVVPFFLLLKTWADLAMHHSEHKQQATTGLKIHRK